MRKSLGLGLSAAAVIATAMTPTAGWAAVSSTTSSTPATGSTSATGSTKSDTPVSPSTPATSTTPASANAPALSDAPADTSDTTVTATVQATGELAIKTPNGANLGPVGPGGLLTNDLGEVTVTDSRNTTVGWTVTAAQSPFMNGNQALPDDAVAAYDPGTITVDPADSIDATGIRITLTGNPQSVVTTSGETDSNTVEWDPSESLTIPEDAIAGTYTATLTHSVN